MLNCFELFFPHINLHYNDKAKAEVLTLYIYKHWYKSIA